MKKVILLGSKPGSVMVLRIMKLLKWNIKAVVISKNHDYSWINGPSLEEEAIKEGIPLYTNQNDLPDEEVDFVISYMYRYLVKKRVRDMAKVAALNFHAGPLPKYAGWAFYNMAILEKVTEYGCTCHYMDDGFDSGDIYKVRTFTVDIKNETAISLEKRTQEEMLHLFFEFTQMVDTVLPRIQQEKSEIRYLTYEEFCVHKEIPINANEETIDRIARAFWYPPYECAYIRWGEVKIEVLPECVKQSLASLLHNNDFNSLEIIGKEIENKIKFN